MVASEWNGLSVRSPTARPTTTRGPMRIAIARAISPLSALLGPAVRRTRATTVVASLLAAFALAAGGSLAGGAAPADAHYLRTTDTFHFPAWSLQFRPCIHRTIGLRLRNFLHGAYAVSASHRTDPDLRQAPIHLPRCGQLQRSARLLVRLVLLTNRFRQSFGPTSIRPARLSASTISPSKCSGSWRRRARMGSRMRTMRSTCRTRPCRRSSRDRAHQQHHGLGRNAGHRPGIGSHLPSCCAPGTS